MSDDNKDTYIDKNGYLRYCDSNYLVHRRKKEKEIRRKLVKGELIHHIDGDKLDNRPENLQLLTAKEHYKIHVVPILEARREAQIKERLVPILEDNVIKLLLYTFTIGGIVLLLIGLLSDFKLYLWQLGLIFIAASLSGLLSWLVQRRQQSRS